MNSKIKQLQWMSLAGVLSSGCLLVLVLTFILLPGTFNNSASQALNCGVATVVLFQGVFVLRIFWRLETSGASESIPFSWCLFAVQHLAFGVGGFLSAISDRDYTYENAFGIFPYQEIIIPLVLVHGVAMNAGLLGTWLAFTGKRRKLMGERAAEVIRLPRMWKWPDLSFVCLSTLILHAAIWLVWFNLRLSGPLDYAAHSLSACTNATYLLWGMAWRECRAKWIFLSYTAVFVLFEMIIGSRGNFAFPLLLFGIGYWVAGPIRLWSAPRLLKWSPVVLFMGWALIASEDVRNVFTRGEITDVGDGLSRVEALSSVTDSKASRDPLGAEMNPFFRIGSRLFELSGADVVARTPDEVPYWGWSNEDSEIFLTGFLPLKMNSGAAFNSSDDAGVLFLHSYGFTQVDPEQGTSMPATLAGDAWRRFSWAGVIVTFTVWAWMLGITTRLLRFRRRGFAKMLFSCALLGYYINIYDSDIVSLASAIPRRLLIAAFYAGIFWVLQEMMAQSDNTDERDWRAGTGSRPAGVPVVEGVR